MKKTINNILNGFCATMQDPDFEVFIEWIRDSIHGNPELNYDQQQLLTLWINKKKNPEDLTNDLAVEMANWINRLQDNEDQELPSEVEIVAQAA